MKTKVARWVVSCLLGLLLLGLLTVPSLASRTNSDLAVGVAPVESSKLETNWQKKVEPGLLKTLEGGQKSNVLIYFSRKPDLSKAAGLSWEERGRFVYDQVKATADQSQVRAIDTLKAFSSAYQSYKKFFSANLIRISNLASQELLEALAKLPEVKEIRRPPVLHLIKPVDMKPAPRMVDAVEWNITDVKAPDLWAQGITGQGIVVANIDTGVRYTHSALVSHYRGNLGGSVFDHNYNWYDPDHTLLSPTDNNGHGTHTMGTMVGDDGAGNQIGMAPEAKWIACQGCDTNSCDDSDLLACADWILAPTDVNGNNPDPSKRPNIVNNSWGGGGCDTWYEGVVASWRAAGIFPSFAAGNDGASGCSSLEAPGDYPESFSTAAYNEAHDIAYFSSRGPVCDGYGPIQWKPNASAPGVYVRSSVNGSDTDYAYYSGTSMAAPHVAGLVALLWQHDLTLKGDINGTFRAITDSAVGVVDGQCDNVAIEALGIPNGVWGYGRIDAYQGMQWSDTNIFLTPFNQRKIGGPGDTRVYTVELYNRTAAPVSANLSLGTHQWEAVLSVPSLTVPAGGVGSFTVTHVIPPMPTISEENVVVTASWAGGSTTAQVSTKSLTSFGCPCPYTGGGVLVFEDFDGGVFPPAGWTVVNNGGTCVWESSQTTGRSNHTGGSLYCADGDSDWCGSGTNTDTELRTPLLDLSSVPNATLSFKSDFYDFVNLDDGYVDISTDAGATWTTLLHYDRKDYRGPRTETIDLTPYVGSASTMIRFRYVAPGWDWWWQVDDVRVYSCVLPASGAAICPASIEASGCPGKQDHVLTLWNLDAQQSFVMQYQAEAGAINGPVVIGPLTQNGSQAFTVSVTVPDLAEGSLIHYSTKATGGVSGATAVLEIAKIIGWARSGLQMPFGAMDNPVVAYDGKIYAVGGYGSGGNVGIYDPDANSWTTGTANGSLPQYPRCGILGRNASGQATVTLFPDATGSPLEIYVYNIATNSWATLPMPTTLPAKGIWAPACVSDLDNNVGYLSGGATTPGGGDLTSLYRYHPATNTIEVLPAMDSYRNFHAAWLYERKLCVAGGVDFTDAELTSTQCFNLATNSWNPENSDLPALPVSWLAMGYDLFCGAPFLAAGIMDGSLAGESLSYDPSTASWVWGAAAPNAVYRASGAAINRNFYLEGGSTGSFNYQPFNALFTKCTCPGSQYTLAADFDAAGLWRYRSSNWDFLTPASPNLMGVYGSNLVANFSGYGLYQHDGTSWALLAGADTAEQLVGAGGKLFVDFGAAGLWQYAGTWTQLTAANPDKMVANGSHLVANFPGIGLYEYNGTSWVLLTTVSTVDQMVAAVGKIFVDFGTAGLWRYAAGAWTQLASANASLLEVYGSNLVGTFPGAGVYLYDGTAWTFLTPVTTVDQMLGVAGKLYVDFGTWGLYRYDGTWEQLTSASPSVMVGVGDDLTANFPGFGLYQYDGTRWNQLTGESATDLIGIPESPH